MLLEYSAELCLLWSPTGSDRELYKQTYSDDMVRENTHIANLCAQWKQETVGYSSISKKVNNEYYREICNSAPLPTVELLLRDMQTEPNHWFVALKHLTGDDPTVKGSSFEEATLAWIEYGKVNGLI